MATKQDSAPKELTMEELAQEQDELLIPFATGDMVKCKVITNSSNRVLCDIGGLTYGFVPEKEFSFDTSELKEGEEITANVMSMENKDGYVVLSLRRADRDRLWTMLQEKMDNGTMVEVKIVGANRGGLMVEAGGIQGFLPVSQLSAAHYPRVDGGDPSQILAKLRHLIGETLSVKIIAVDKNDEKLIFSEKMAGGASQAALDESFEVGQMIEGAISGIAPFGLFINLGSIEGLVHISEVAWEHVDDLNKLFKAGEKVKAKIVKIEDGKVSLSIKRLQADPWIEQMKKLKVGQKIEGEVSKMTAYGAFVRLDDGLDGLVHASTAGGDVEKIKTLQQGDKHKFEVIELKPEARRIGLRLID